jgi:CHAT domain-containing protein
MHRDGKRFGGDDEDKWNDKTITGKALRKLRFLWIAAFLPLIALQCTYIGNSQHNYDHAFQLFLHGYLRDSQQEASRGYARCRLSSTGWPRKFLLLEAESMIWRGFYEEALGLLSQHAPSFNSIEETIQKTTLEGVAFVHLQEFSLANQRLAKAEGLCGIASKLACGEVLRARGLLNLERDDFSGARHSFLDSLQFARTHNDGWLEATSLLNLSTTSLEIDHLDEAENLSKSAYQVAAKLGGEDIAMGASGNLGWAYFGLGDSDRALELFQEAEKVATRLGNVRDQVKWLKTAAYVYRDYGNLTKAEETFQQALDLATQINSKQDILDTLEDLSHVSVDAGDLEKASEYIRRVTPLVNVSGNNLDISYVSLAQGKVAAARREDSQAETLFRKVELDPASQVSMRFDAEHELARLFEIQGRTSDAEGMYKTALSTFEGARQQLKDDDSKLPFLANATRIYDDYIHFLITQGKTDEALIVADQSRARMLAQGLGQAANQRSFGTAPLAPRAVAGKADATLLFYWLGKKQSYLWAITPEKTALFTLPAEREIAPLIERYRKVLLGAEDPMESSNATGQRLYTMLVAPAAQLIRRDVPVMILADGPLSLLNFETLLVPEQGQGPHYWIEDATVISAPSLAMLAAAKPARSVTRNPAGKLLLLGDAVSPGEDYPELPFASTEMKEIKKHFAAGSEVVFARQQATPGAYLASDPRQFAYIHFVSHGVASRMDPLDSAIILSRSSSPANGGDSFKLYAREVMQHPIDARVVTVSACYGSGTRAYVGEGLVGLSWAFLRAGAHNAIGALWEASDSSTPRLMDAFYQGLEDGQSPAAALRQAKLTLLHSRSSFRKPFYWAPFQIYTRI